MAGRDFMQASSIYCMYVEEDPAESFPDPAEEVRRARYERKVLTDMMEQVVDKAEEYLESATKENSKDELFSCAWGLTPFLSLVPLFGFSLWFLSLVPLILIISSRLAWLRVPRIPCLGGVTMFLIVSFPQLEELLSPQMSNQAPHQ